MSATGQNVEQMMEGTRPQAMQAVKADLARALASQLAIEARLAERAKRILAVEMSSAGNWVTKPSPIANVM